MLFLVVAAEIKNLIEMKDVKEVVLYECVHVTEEGRRHAIVSVE